MAEHDLSARGAPPYETGLSFPELVRVLVRHKWTIVLVTLVITAIAVALAMLIRPEYRAQVSLAPPAKQQIPQGISAIAGQFGGLASLAGIDLESGEESKLAYEVLRSRAFAEQFIRDNGLVDVLVDDADEPLAIRHAYRVFDEEVRSVEQDRKTGLVRLNIDWHDPEVAASWANQLVSRLNGYMRQKALDESQKSIRFLNEQLERTSVVEVRQAVYDLIAIEIKKMMLANVREEYAYRVVDPAVVVDEDMFHWPRRPLIIVGGVVLGLLCGSLLVIFRKVILTEPPAAA